MSDVQPTEGLSRRSWWLLLIAVVTVTVGLHLWKLGEWPWGTDEEHTLRELGMLDTDICSAPPPGSLGIRITRLMPVWYGTQWVVLRTLGVSELTSRVLAAVCGILVTVLLYLVGLRRRGVAFALALVVLMNGSQFFIWLSQQNRFYTMAVLFVALALTFMSSDSTRKSTTAACLLFSVLAIFSHSLAIVVLGVAFCSSVVCWLLGWASQATLSRSALAAGLAGAVYWFYVRPMAGTWTQDFPESNSIVSFAAQMGIPTLAMALLGAAASVCVAAARREIVWWALMSAGAVMFVAAVPWLMPSWNPRYGILFAVPIWMTAAFGMEHVTQRLSDRRLAVVWYGVVVLLLAPKLASHYVDGSEHDLRGAARVVADVLEPDEPVYSMMDPRLKYYLPPPLRKRVMPWAPSKELPAEQCLVVQVTNLWTPPPVVEGRTVDVMCQIARRRFDEQSHVVRICRVHEKAAASSRPKTAEQGR